MKRLILASASPTRKRLLEQIGVKFEVIASNFEEDMTLKLSPTDLAMHLSASKARDVALRVQNAVVIGADTFGVCDGKLMGKPHNAKTAAEFLRTLSGRMHEMVTGLTIIDTDSGQELGESITTKVYFRTLSNKEINDYIATGESLDKGGGYAALEQGGAFIDRIEGDFFSITGLPLGRLAHHLQSFGISIFRAA